MWKKIKDLLEKKMEDFIEKAEIAIKFFGGIKFLIMWLIIFYVLMGYNYQIRSWYNDNIIPTLDRFEPNTWIFWITFLPIFFVVCNLLKRSLVRYQSDKKEISILLFISIILIIYRCSGDYDYVPFTENVSYVDLIWVICVTYLTVAIINKCRLYYTIWKKKNKIKQNSLLNDWPIESASQDRYGFKNEVDKIVPKIIKLDSRKAWSLAINAPWGTGKTSFINLIEEKIKKEADFEIIKFNPRNSKSASHIQEDFFNTLASALSKYDSSFSHNIKAYMESLQLIDKSGIVKKIVDFYHIWNKKSLKESIEQSFVSLKKRVLVVVDDFDRLTKEEILEVLKLIDSNAAFPKLVFITAYDKEQVNKILNDLNVNFIDKFFNLEYSLPPHSSLCYYLLDAIDKDLRLDSKEKDEIISTINHCSQIFDENIQTIREAKRFINQFVVDFELVRDYVFVEDFLFIQLIKYRYYDSYKKIQKKEYIEFDGDCLILKDNLNIEEKLSKILNVMFQKRYHNNSVETYRHIYNSNAFNFYFVDKTNSSLKRKDIEILYSLDWEEVTRTIDEWLYVGKGDDLIDLLEKYAQNNLRYIEIVTYVACKKAGLSTITKLFYNIISNNYQQKYNVDSNANEKILGILRKYDSKLELRKIIHYYYITKERDEKDNIIKDREICEDFKTKFISDVKDSEIDEFWLIDLLRYCLDSEKYQPNTYILDADCLKAYRDRIEKDPTYFISHFVGLNWRFSNPQVNFADCESLWSQIFGNEKQFEEYLKKCRDIKNNKGNIIEKVDLVWNFWRLYKANGNKAIFFEFKGNVQEIIDNGFFDECDDLDKLLAIQEEVNAIPDSAENLDSSVKSRYIKTLDDIITKLINVKLYIKLKRDIFDKIKRKKQIMEI